MINYGGLLFLPPYNLHKCCVLIKDIGKNDVKYSINY